MNTPQLSPYLNFNGNCKEAMDFYKSVLGGELTVSTFGEGMPDGPADQKDRIMHASLDNGTMSFMASDTMPDGEYIVGNNVHLSIAGMDEAAIRSYYTGLAEGGKIEMPLEKAPWGDTFGMITDKFGIHWMFNIGMESK